jgi:putative hydrolase of the HAD superfamily
MAVSLKHIDTWIFDLDNTLYAPSVNLFAQIDVRMRSFIADLLACDVEEATRIQKSFFRAHGTTLRGLMDEHRVEPRQFLDFVHDVDLSALVHDRRLIEGIARLPGRKLIFTNADATYARRVLAGLGLDESFEAIHDIHAAGYLPKPDERAYASLLSAHAIDPRGALFVEDMARNLEPAKKLGMTTVWVNNGAELGSHGADPRFIDIEVEDVGAWIETLLADMEQA